MIAIVWVTLGFSAMSALLLTSDWIRIHRPSLFRDAGREVVAVTVNAPAWALEELRFGYATERLTRAGAAVAGPACAADLSHLYAAA